jgi:hypothetical protein
MPKEIAEVVLANLGKPIEKLLQENRDISFDLKLAEEICKVRGIPFDSNATFSTLEGFLEKLRSSGAQTEFLLFYIANWRVRDQGP